MLQSYIIKSKYLILDRSFFKKSQKFPFSAPFQPFAEPISFAPLGTLLAILGFLPGRARTVGAGDVLLLFRLSLHLALIRILPLAASSELDARDKDVFKIIAHKIMEPLTIPPEKEDEYCLRDFFIKFFEYILS